MDNLNEDVEDEFELQLRQEELERQAKKDGESLSRGLTYTDEDGTVMEWDHERKAYFPKIDADFIAQYQINYGVTDSVEESNPMTEEERKAKEEEYWRYFYSVNSQQQPALPKFDEEGNPIEEEENTGDAEKKNTGDEGQTKKTAEDGNQSVADASWDPTSEEHYQYNLYYYGKEYADEYRAYYRDHPNSEALPDWMNMKTAASEASANENTQESGKKGKKKGDKPEKRKEPPREEGWFETDTDKSTQIYASGLPLDITEEEFEELMSKCGLIMYDPFTRKPKIKLYKDKEGKLKGDGLCSYIKVESVALALQILDGFDVRGHKISVEKAKFQLKGEFDPKKKKKKLNNKQKQKLREKQQKLFDWRPDKNPFERAKHERIVILKNMFDIHEFEMDPTLINELRLDVREECTKFGEVKKVTLYDRHPEGVISVMFKEPEEADSCIAALNGRWFAKRQISAATHDGKTKYEVHETEEEKAKRLRDWQIFLETGVHPKPDTSSSNSTPVTAISGDGSQPVDTTSSSADVSSSKEAAEVVSGDNGGGGAPSAASGAATSEGSVGNEGSRETPSVDSSGASEPAAEGQS